MLKLRLRELALAQGFADCRVAVARPAAHRAVFEQWVAEGRHGDMAWMARQVERRGDPGIVLPGAKSVIMLAMNYFTGTNQPGVLEGKIARYAWNDDYHDLIQAKLDELDRCLREQGGVQKCYVDTGPVLERDFAGESGLGWNGKSTMQIHRTLGTWFFLATIITTLDVDADEPQRDHCGKCTRCMNACPTQAITAPHRMDARRCVSYLTIEHRGSIPHEFRRAIGDRIYGCDDCLTVCPWNRFARISNEAAFLARDTVFGMKLRDFLKITDEDFRRIFRKSPIKRIKRPAFLRNVCVALGNIGTADDLPALQDVARHEVELVAEHARWAITEILARSGD